MHLGPHALLIVMSVELVSHLNTAGVEAVTTRLRARLAHALGDVTSPRLIVIEPAASRASGSSPERPSLRLAPGPSGPAPGTRRG
jgi:hypothetical protein